MQIHLNIVASGPVELAAALNDLAKSWSTTGVASAPAAVAAPAEAVKEPTDISTPAKKPGRPKKAAADVTDIDSNGDAVSHAPVSPAIAAVTIEVAQPQPTVEQARDAIKALMTATDENTTFELLKAYGAKSASTLHATGKAGEFIVKANEMIAAKKASA